jgi:hypothetical protein
MVAPALFLKLLEMAVRPSEFGEQTEEMAEFGFSEEEITELRQRKVV